MYDNSKASTNVSSSEILPLKDEFEPEEKRIVREMNQTMHVKPLLKQYFYDYVVQNNDKYTIFSSEDAKEFINQKHRMENKVRLIFMSTSLTFGGLYFWKYGFKRSSSLWRHGAKLFAIAFLLPSIPTNILSMKLCQNERERMLQLTNKYPVNDEKLFRDFIAYALPKLKEKCYEELDKRKRDSL